MCRRLHRIVESTSKLWAHIEFDFILTLDKKTLTRILKHSRQIRTLLFDSAVLDGIDLNDFNWIFQEASFCNIVWLNLSRTPISTLCFLTETRHLEIFNASECKNLLDEEFSVLQTCNKLEHLYVSFTKITPETVEKICFGKPIVVLDACEIYFDVPQCQRILKNTIGHIAYMHISIKHDVDESDFNKNILSCYQDTSIVIYKNHESF